MEGSGERETRIKPIYRLIKLRTDTVEDLNRLKAQMGKGSLDDMITMMIRLTDTYRLGLKEEGWYVHSKR
jgi:hypothetical protein